jgi:4-carboxymuconolactone decarboxylase
MATRRALLAALSGAVFAGTARAQQTVLLQERKETKMKITRAFSGPSKGPAEYFTGSVQIHSRYQGDAPARVGGAFVTFEPGARTAWHTHPLGQTLIVMSGKGWTQTEGGPRQEINEGDVVWIPAGEKHWHGATATEAMTHFAVAEALDGKSVDWLEHVTDAQYGQPG